jgi:hypothetical protein
LHYSKIFQTSRNACTVQVFKSCSRECRRFSRYSRTADHALFKIFLSCRRSCTVQKYSRAAVHVPFKIYIPKQHKIMHYSKNSRVAKIIHCLKYSRAAEDHALFKIL